MKDKSENCEEYEEQSSEKSIVPLRRYQIVVLCLCCYINFISNMSFTILASFFDDNATKHGLTKTEVGFIVAIYAGIATVGCPIFGIFLAQIGKKFTLIAGLTCAAVCAGLFAFLDDIEDPSTYLWIGILLRGVQAVGVSAYFTATYALLVEEWRGSRLSLALGVYEAFTGLGMILGPITGSILYSVGGYRLPFLVVCGMLLLAAIINLAALENKDVFGQIGADEDEALLGNETISTKDGIKTLLSSGLFLIPNLLMIPVWSCMDFAIPFVGTYLEECEPGTTKIQVGLLFVVFAVAYMLTSPLWGFLCGQFPVSRSLMFWGSFLAALSYFFLGPSPWLQNIGLYYSCSFTRIALVMAVLGLSLAAAIIPSCNEMVEVARAEGVEEQTSDFIGGLINSLIFLGEFVGPTFGGYMLDYAHGDFPVGCSFFSIVCMVIVFLCGVWWIGLLMKRKWKQKKESAAERDIRNIRNTEERYSRRIRRRIHSQHYQISTGPKSLTESLGSSLRIPMHCHEPRTSEQVSSDEFPI
ncbi:Oidioi.mRNA.OKI2018_I69.XSR.g13706.t1.cds [Oikopleura dioica]|uniref:Oidioi.mRNA.OKI2018_I69.XSR.g13706.t1.cds n=1 Tax=Oikopleura dioica TaxID=34765 RepID=A0ABN7S9D6_OIKDI|nr:Oidioi.mRNA.OKI2018_I69.XSR.g13706.t1.cds [Oikopleura dioica]